MSMTAEMSVPMKPPRVNKKETGILMSVIKTLSTTVSNEQRDREKAKLEKEFKKSEQRLESLIAKHEGSLSEVMHAFSEVCTKIDLGKRKVLEVKNNLQKCKSLLQCRRDELERLWLEGIEHKHALELLNQIESIRNVPDAFNKALGRKQYLVCAQVLTKASEGWNENLDRIEGLKDIFIELKIKKKKLYEVLKDELNNELYQKWTNPGDIKAGVGGLGGGGGGLFQRSSSDRRSSGRNRMGALKARKILMEFPNLNSNQINGNSGSGGGESEDLMGVIVECIGLLQELPKFIHDVKHNIEEKLHLVINQTSQQIIEMSETGGIGGSGITGGPGIIAGKGGSLVELLQLTFDQFRWILRSHVNLISLIQASVQKKKLHLKVSLYSEDDVLKSIQNVLKSTLRIYFDLGDSMKNGRTGNSVVEAVVEENINSFFTKKKQQRPKRIPLFKFEYSLHGLDVNDLMINEQTPSLDRSYMDKGRFLVSSPNSRNMILTYNPILEFIKEIEQNSGIKCDLHKFMLENVSKVFVQQMYKEMSDLVESSKKTSSDSWKDVVISPEESRPLLSSVVQIGRAMSELEGLSRDLPSHSPQLIRILDALLSTYREACEGAFSSIIRPEIHGIHGNTGNNSDQTGDHHHQHHNNHNHTSKGIISASFVLDEDIQRLLKSLPNWVKLCKAREGKDDLDLSTSASSPEDHVLRAQNVKESDLLCGIFGGKVIQGHELLLELRLLEQLAHFQESMDWMALKINSTSIGLQRNLESLSRLGKGKDGKEEESSEILPILAKLAGLSGDFKELADICLIVLHLEVRVHCFFYLLPVWKKSEFAPGVDSQLPDPEVIQMTKDLTEFETAILPSLQPLKVRYIFEGLGQLISTVLINGAGDMRRINENGVKRVCRDIFAIQQTLCGITNHPEHPLDHARMYYELFLLTPEELVDTVLEKGPSYKELEYINALRLLYRSRPGSSTLPLDDLLQKLSSILGDVGVTV